MNESNQPQNTAPQPQGLVPKKLHIIVKDPERNDEVLADFVSTTAVVGAQLDNGDEKLTNDPNIKTTVMWVGSLDNLSNLFGFMASLIGSKLVERLKKNLAQNKKGINHNVN